MANYAVLKAAMAAVIRTNGEQYITGNRLQVQLTNIINALTKGYQLMGVVTPADTYTTGDENVAFLAATAGTYTAFGGAVVNEGEIVLLKYNGSWSAEVVFDGTGYAKQSGVYPGLTSGAAQNLVGRGSVPASFLFRTSGGSADIGTGSAKITKLEGNSLVWNQLLDAFNESKYQSPGVAGATMTISGGVISITTTNQYTGRYQPITIIQGHKYLATYEYKTAVVGINLGFGVYNSSGVAGLKEVTIDTNGAWKSIAGIFTADAYNSLWGFFVQTRTEGVSGQVDCRNAMLVDLTALFNGNVPANYSVEDFERDFPLDYYAYDAGGVLTFAAQNLVTTGFNQWDEEWEVGSIDSTTGEKITDSTKIRTKNPIPIFPETEYYGKAGWETFSFLMRFYDANMNYIGNVNYSGNAIFPNSVFKTPTNAAYMMFACPSVYGTTYNHDICINLSWSGYRNGEYEPYEKHTAEIDPASWLDTDGNLIFPYGGMHGTGSAADWAKPEADGYFHKGTRVFERIDLGTLNWTNLSGTNVFFSGTVPNMKSLSQCISDRYEAGTPGDTGDANNGPDKCVRCGSDSRVLVKDTAYSDAAAFKTAMDGVYLYVELATPVEKELATPVPATYYVNDFGTEAWTPANADEPYTTPCKVEIAYAMNAVDALRNLPKNYISKASFDNFCGELAAELGAAIGKSITITPTYDAETQEYDYTITIADVDNP